MPLLIPRVINVSNLLVLLWTLSSFKSTLITLTLSVLINLNLHWVSMARSLCLTLYSGQIVVVCIDHHDCTCSYVYTDTDV